VIQLLQQIDGVAIASATVEHILNFGVKSPKVLFSTHFSELFTLNLIPCDDPNLEFLTMDIMVSDSETGPTVHYLYKLKLGFSLHSYGFHCAKLAGVPQDLISRAECVAECLCTNQPIKPIDQASQNTEAVDKLIQYFLQFDCEKGPLSDLLALVHAIKE